MGAPPSHYSRHLPPVLASRFIFIFQVCLIERVKSRFRKDRTKHDEYLLKMLQTVSNHESSGNGTRCDERDKRDTQLSLFLFVMCIKL